MTKSRRVARGYRAAPEEIREGAERRHGRASPAHGAGAGGRAAVRLPDRETAGTARRRCVVRQAERAVPGAAHSRRGGLAGQRSGAVRERAAAALLPHHGARACRARTVDRELDRDAPLRRIRLERSRVMSKPTPRSIAEYLEQLRSALGNADAALLQDAQYDAEEYLRSELAEHPEWDEATMLAHVATRYGAPEEVAEIYREQETKVENALRSPSAPPRRSVLGRFFGVMADPLAYSSLFYLLLSLATGIFYFTWAVTGLSLSLGLAILILGVPFAVFFVSTVRALSLVEGRLVEVMLGVRMPRRPLYADRGKPFGTRVKNMFTDPRTWST